MKFLPLAFLAVAACAPANAQQMDGGRIIAQLEKADANNDGAISRSEFSAFRVAQFSRLDRNKDGFITDQDMPAALKQRLPPELSFETMKASFDLNKDGKVSEEEFVRGPTKVFDRLDANGDDSVSKAELETARSVLASRR